VLFAEEERRGWFPTEEAMVGVELVVSLLVV
jgi:hypothetical protein